MGQTFTVAAALAAQAANTLPADAEILDTASDVASNLDALQTLAAAGAIVSISLLNPGRPDLPITETQLTTDAAAVALIDTPYQPAQIITAAEAATAVLAPGFTSFEVVDTAANLQASLPAVEALWKTGLLSGTRLTDSGAPVFDLTAAQVAAGADVLAQINTAHTIVLTDSGTPTITLSPWSTYTDIFTNVLARITTPYTLAASVPIRAQALASDEDGVDRYTADDAPYPAAATTSGPAADPSVLPNGLTVIDWGENIAFYLDSLEAAAAAGKITSILIRDSGPVTLTITAAQYTADQDAIALLSPNYALSEIVSAAQASTATLAALPTGFTSYTIQDTAANIVANLDAIDALARGGLLNRIDSAPAAAVFYLSAAELGRDAYALLYTSSNYTVAFVLTDTGTPTVTISADLLSYSNTRTYVLNPVVGNYSLAVTGSVSASVAAAIATENNKVLASLAAPLTVADYANNVVSSLSGLEALAADGKLGSIRLLDGNAVTTIYLTAAQQTAAAAVLADIVTPYVVATLVSGTAATIAGELGALETQAEAGTLGSITLTNGGTPALSISAATLSADALAITHISSAYSIALTDGGTPSVTLREWQVADGGIDTVLGKVTSPYTLTITDTLGSYAASNLVNLASKIATPLTFYDYSNSIETNLAALETLAQGGKIASIILSDGAGAKVPVTVAQATADAAALALITTPHTLSLVISAAQAATATLPGGFPSFTVKDTAANVVANLGSLEALAVKGLLSSIQLTGSTVISLSAAQVAANVLALGLINQSTIVLTDGGTPTITLPAGDLNLYQTVYDVLARITSPYKLTIDGTLFSYSASNLATVGGAVLSSLTAPLTILDHSQAVVSNLGALTALANAGALGAINLNDGGVPDLNLSATQVTADAAALAKITTPYTTSLTTRTPLSATAAEVVDELPTLEASAAAGTLGPITLTDSGTPVLTISPATLVADALALANIQSAYTIFLTGGGTASLLLTGAQASYGPIANVLSRVTTPFTITITDVVSAYVPGILANANLIGKLAAPLSVADYNQNIQNSIDRLEELAAAGRLASIAIQNGPGTTIAITASQATADQIALAAITTPYSLSLIVTDAADVASTSLPTGFGSFTVSATASNVAANLADLETAAAAGLLAGIEFVGSSVVDITAAEFSAYAYALSKLTTYQYSIHLTDPGTPAITLTSDVFLNYSVLDTLLPAIDGPYSLSVTGPISAYQVSSILAAPAPVLASLASQFTVLDYSQSVVTNIAALETLATDGLLGTIELTDGNIPTLDLTSSQATANSAVLSKIVGPYLLENGSEISGSAASILAELDTLEAQAVAGTLTSITLTDSGTPLLSLTAAQFAADAVALSLITSQFAISLTNTGRPAIALSPYQIGQYKVDQLLQKIASPYTLAITGPLPAYAVANLASDGLVSGLGAAVDVTDYSSNVLNYLDSLQVLAAAGKLGTVTFLDSGTPNLFITAARATADAGALAAITTPYNLSLTVTAAASATAVLPAHFDTLNVSDTQANIIDNLPSLEQQALTGRLVGITITDHNALTLSVATLEANLDAIGRITGNPPITLTDSGTPTITIAEWQVDNANLNALSQITGPFTLTVTDPVRPSNAVRFVSVDGGDLVSHLAPDSLVIRDSQGNFFNSNLSQLETLLPKIASIDLRTSQAIINFTTTEATADSGLLTKMVDPYVLAQDITVAQIGTPLAAGFSGYAIVDTAAHITAGLGQIETLALNHELLSVDPTDAAPIFTLSAATISADADALDEQNLSSYPIILTDTGTPTITLQSYQLNYNMLNNILGAISGPFNLDIVGRVSANTASTMVTEDPSVLADLVTPLNVSDSAGYISTDLDELEALAKLGKLGSVLVLDGATTPITVSSTQQETADHDALALFTAPPILQVTCFLAGTRIATDGGEVAVDDLRIGDRVITSDKREAAAIRWIGHRRLDARSHPSPTFVHPVRIRRGAFADSVPHRDLLISPDHAVFIDGLLVPARLLVNGATILQDLAITDITYFHIELDRHAVLLSEGLPTESYLDTGNRGLFENGAAPLMLHPDLTDADGQAARESLSCAPFAADAARIEPLWRRLAARAYDLGHDVPAPATTSDPALRIRAGGRDHDPIAVTAGRHIFAVPRSAKTVRLVSRAAMPCDVAPWIDDRRLLGVRVGRIIMSGADGVADIPIDHPALTAGWHPIEPEWWTFSRWTDGDAVLPILADTRLLEVHLAGSMTYDMELAAKRNSRIGHVVAA